jgi:hypothetical protein
VKTKLKIKQISIIKCFEKFDVTVRHDLSITHGLQWAHMTQKKVEWKEHVRDDVTDEPILEKPDGIQFGNETCQICRGACVACL